MNEALWVAVGVTVWHVSMLSGLGLYSGAYAESWGLAPKSILLGKDHLWGAFLAALAVGTFVLSAHLAVLSYGIFLSGALLLADTYLLARAFWRWMGTSHS